MVLCSDSYFADHNSSSNDEYCGSVCSHSSLFDNHTDCEVGCLWQLTMGAITVVYTKLEWWKWGHQLSNEVARLWIPTCFKQPWNFHFPLGILLDQVVGTYHYKILLPKIIWVAKTMPENIHVLTERNIFHWAVYNYLGRLSRSSHHCCPCRLRYWRAKIGPSSDWRHCFYDACGNSACFHISYNLSQRHILDGEVQGTIRKYVWRGWY